MFEEPHFVYMPCLILQNILPPALLYLHNSSCKNPLKAILLQVDLTKMPKCETLSA